MARRFDDVLRKGDPDVARWSTYVGRGAIRFYLPLDVQLPNNFFSPGGDRRQGRCGARAFAAKLEKVLANEFPSLVGRVSALELGPPVGWPVQYRVSGPDITQVRDIALKLAQVVATNPHAVHVNFDWFEPSRQVRIRIDQNEVRLLGLSSQALASVLNTVISGSAITQVRDDIYLVDVVVRATDEQRVSLDYVAFHPGAAAERADRAAQPICDVRVRSGVTAGLAARPDSDPDGAGRHRAGHASGDGGRARWVRQSRSCPRACRDPTASWSAERWRKARNRWPR